MSSIDGVKLPLLVPGTYTGTCISYELNHSFSGSAKLKFAFRIDYKNDPVIHSYFNIKKTSKTEFRVGRSRALFRNTVFLLKKPEEIEDFESNDFINFYLNKDFNLQVETVHKDSNRRELPEYCKYSKVAFIDSFKQTVQS